MISGSLRWWNVAPEVLGESNLTALGDRNMFAFAAGRNQKKAILHKTFSVKESLETTLQAFQSFIQLFKEYTRDCIIKEPRVVSNRQKYQIPRRYVSKHIFNLGRDTDFGVCCDFLASASPHLSLSHEIHKLQRCLHLFVGVCQFLLRNILSGGRIIR